MELTQDTFNEFKERLHFHNKGVGVKKHCTSNPIFIVQKLDRVYSLDSSYADKWIIRNANGECHWDSVKELLDDLYDEELKQLFKNTGCSSKADYLAMDEYEQRDWLEDLDFERVYYIEQWLHVNSHFTREGAEAFIQRKKHDYPGGLRIYVESQYYCWEYNMIIQGLLSGEIRLLEKSEEKETI